MKKNIKHFLLLCIITVIMAPSYVLSFDNLSSSRQPTGFRGINWGESKYDHPYLFSMYDNVNGIETFNRELENLTLGKAKLSEITYHFYHDKFYQVSITLKSDKDHQPLLDALTESYGTAEIESGIYVWENETVSIRLFPGGASISYLPIFNELHRRRQRGIN